MIDEWIARERARDQAEWDRWMDNSTKEPTAPCAGCKYVWSTVSGTQARAPQWIPEAQAYWHVRCYQRFKESK